MPNGIFNISQDFVRVFEDWAIYTAIFIGVIIGLMKSWSKLKTYLKMDNFFIVHSEIHELLTELRLVTDSARAQIIQLHNGEYFMDGVSMRKFSLTHESLEKGIASDGSRIRGFLCSMFIPLLNLVVEDDAKLHYSQDLKDSYFKQYLESRNVEAFSVIPIWIQNEITGFLMIQWCSSLKAEIVDKTLAVHEITKIRNSVAIQLGLQTK